MGLCARGTEEGRITTKVTTLASDHAAICIDCTHFASLWSGVFVRSVTVIESSSKASSSPVACFLVLQLPDELVEEELLPSTRETAAGTSA